MIKYKDSKELCERCEINWENWNRLIEKTRKDIAETLKKCKYLRHSSKTYIYNSDGELTKEFETQLDCTNFMGGSNTTVSNYIRRQWNYKGYLLSNVQLSQDKAKERYKYNVEHGNTYIEGDTKKRVPIYCYNEDGLLVGAYETQYQWNKVFKKGTSFIKDTDRIVENRLVSKHRYDVSKAKKMYQVALANEPNQLSVYIYNENGELIKEKAPTRNIIELTNYNHHQIYRKFAINPYFYDSGYVISKQPLTQLEAFEIALKGNNFKKSKK